MRISDWSSDVCSSDLGQRRGVVVFLALKGEQPRRLGRQQGLLGAEVAAAQPKLQVVMAPALVGVVAQQSAQHLRSEERRVGKSVPVRVDLGGRRIIKKNTKNTT